MFNVNRNVRCLFLKCGDLRMCSTIRSSLGGQVWLEWTIIHLKRGTSRLLLPYMVACLICCITVKIKHASLLFLVDTIITYGHHCLRIAGKPFLLVKPSLQGQYTKLTLMKDVTVFYTTDWNVMLSILRSQMDFCTVEIHLGYQNRQDYISKGCKTYHNILHSSEFHITALLRRFNE